MTQHLRVRLNIVTLKQYLEKKMIPRGLRLKKNPTFSMTPDCTTKWNSILSDCSLKLIQLMIANEQYKIGEINNKKIEKTKKTLDAYSTNSDFSDLQSKLNINLEEFEKNLMSIKKSKFA